MYLTAILLFFAAASAASPEDRCPAPNVKTYPINLSKIPSPLFYCAGYVKKPNKQFCTCDVQSDKDQSADLTLHYKATGNNGVDGDFSFKLDLVSDGVYNLTGLLGSSLKGQTFITGVSQPGKDGAVSISCIKCFSGEQFGGEEDSGISVGVVSTTLEGCKSEDTKKMAKMMEKEVLNGEKLNWSAGKC